MSEIKVNKISPRTACGTTTLGDSGDTFTIPAGVTITNNGTAAGFGATGAASWDTTVKTTGFTAVSGVGYFVNTTAGAISVNLPAGTAGDVVAIKDYAKTFDTNACTLVQNGSDKIGGSTDNVVLGEEGIAITLVYVDATQGWLVTDSGLQSEATVPAFICASVSGACNTLVTVDTNYKVATFVGPGTFTVNSVGNPSGSNEVSYLVVAGGGGGASDNSGGGGAGGFREGKTPQCTYTASPIACTSGSNDGLPVSAQAYAIVIGGGGPAGAPGNSDGTNGNLSSFSTITSAGGGGGAAANACASNRIGSPGGSGGGGAIGTSSCATAVGGTGNTPSVTPAQGQNGGGSVYNPSVNGGGGGGGATAVGTDMASSGGSTAGSGGAGATTSINGTPTAFAGGGGGAAGGSNTAGGGGSPCGTGGYGGANSSSPATRTGAPPSTPSIDTRTGTINTGGGGGASNTPGGTGSSAGGSGIVIIRYKFQ